MLLLPGFATGLRAQGTKINYQTQLGNFPANCSSGIMIGVGTSNVCHTLVASDIPNPAGDVTGTYAATVVSGTHLAGYTVSALPAASSNSGLEAIVTDGASLNDCTVGGGTDIVLCRSNGSAWVALGSGSGGFSNPMTTLGDTIYGGTSGVATRLAGNTTTSVYCMLQQGTGSASAAPYWGTCPSGSMVYPAAGVAVSTGSAWGTSLTAPSGSLVGTTDTQTLTNKTVDGVTPTTFGYVDPTSSIQTQMDAKAPLASPTFTGTVTLPGATVAGAFTGTGAYVPVSMLNSGTGASSTTFWRGDGTWATPSAGNVSTQGTITAGTFAEWYDGTHIESLAWPGAGIVVSTGSAFGTSLTAPSGAIVGTTDTQTLTNKTLTSPTINGAALSGTLSGSPTFSGTPVFSNTLALNTSGNAGTATDLASYPTLCTGSQFSQGLSSGSNNCATPSGSGVTIQTNGTSNSSQTLLNMITSTTNSVGLTVTPSNPSGGEEKFEITGSSYTGNAATATTATTATNLGGTTSYSLPYQSASATTGYLSPEATNNDYALIEHVTASAAVAPTWSNAPVLSGANLTALPTSTSLYPTLNQSTTGNAATATDLSSYPTLCSSGQFSQGLSSGSNNCATPSGSGGDSLTNFQITDEFCGGNSAAGFIGGLNWSFTASGSGSMTVGTPDANHPCVGEMDTGTTSGSSVYIQLDNPNTSSFPLVPLSGVTFSSTFVFRVTATANVNQDVGFWANSGYIIVGYDTGSSQTDWTASTNDGSTSTTQDMGIAPVDGDWVKVQIRSTTAGTILFSMCQASGSSGCTLGTEYSISTHLPTGQVRPQFFVANYSTADDILDYNFFSFDMTTSR